MEMQPATPGRKHASSAMTRDGRRQTGEETFSDVQCCLKARRMCAPALGSLMARLRLHLAVDEREG